MLLRFFIALFFVALNIVWFLVIDGDLKWVNFVAAIVCSACAGSIFTSYLTCRMTNRRNR